MKRAGHLFKTLVSEQNLKQAIAEVNRTHHWKPGHRPNACTAWVEETMLERVEELREILLAGFEPQKPKISERYDKSARKIRTISEPVQWPDQYVHHALIQVLQPIFMRGMDRFACGSIRKRGPHYAKRYIERWLKYDQKGTRYELCADIRHFYDSLTPAVVMDRMRQLIKDRQILDLIERVLKDGVLIGAYPSQWFANTVLQPLDQMIRQSGLCSYYVRYMDNLTIFAPNKRKLRKLKGMIAAWLSERGLEIKGDWQVFPVMPDEAAKPLTPPREGVMRTRHRLPDAVGYRYGRNFTLPRKHNLIRAKRGLARYHRKRRKGERIPACMAAGILSRLGQLKHCNNYNLYRYLFRGERIIRELKRVVRDYQGKEMLTWSMYLAQRAALRRLKQRGAITAA